MNIALFFDTTTIICGAAVIILAILSSLMNPFFRFLPSHDEEEEPEEDNDNTNSEQNTASGDDKALEASDSEGEESLETSENQEEKATNANDQETSSLPKLTVILTPHEEAEKLEQHLPDILQQDYPAGYQVIVVTEFGAHDTLDVLKRFKHSMETEPDAYPNVSLYVTYIPNSSRYMSRKRLAMTLGVKAAQTQWVVFIESDSTPSSRQWLQHIGKACTMPDTKMVIGYGHFEPETPTTWRFDRLQAACYLLREDVKGTAYRTLSHTVAIQKDEFMQNDGFEGSLSLVRGEYDCLVNKYAEKGMTQIVTHPQAIMTDDTPTKRAWHSNCLFYLATRRHLSRSLAHRLLFLTDQILLHLNACTILGIALWGVLAQKWVRTGAAGLAFILTMILRLWDAHRALSRLREPISLWAVLPLELTVIWRRLGTAMRYLFASPYDFTTHKQ